MSADQPVIIDDDDDATPKPPAVPLAAPAPTTSATERFVRRSCRGVAGGLASVVKHVSGSDCSEWFEEGADCFTEASMAFGSDVREFARSETGHRCFAFGVAGIGAYYGINNVRPSALATVALTAVVTAGANNMVNTVANSMPTAGGVMRAVQDTLGLRYSPY